MNRIDNSLSIKEDGQVYLDVEKILKLTVGNLDTYSVKISDFINNGGKFISDYK